MAEITPFKGVRYTEKKNHSLVVSPPYDIITPAQQEMYYQRDSHNIVKIDFGKSFSSDDDKENVYTRSANYLEQWLKEEILKKDDEPAFYVYYIDYIHPYTGEAKTLKGFFSLVKAEPFGKGSVIPHEHTFPSHRKDRLELIKTCRGNLSPVFSLYSDSKDEVLKSLSVEEKEPQIDLTDDDGNRHRLWVVKEGTEKVVQLFNDKKIYIADGHHRYTTSVTYRAERNRIDPDDTSADYIMMFLANMDDPGISILPTHRVVNKVRNKEWLLESLKGKFDIEVWENKDTQSFCDFQKNLRQQNGSVFGVVFEDGKEYYLLKLKKERKDLLDIEILTKYIIEWIYSKDEIYNAENISYIKDPSDVVNIVKDGGKQYAGFLLKGIEIGEMIGVIENGAKMPHKSTYFYPKPATGLVLHTFET